MKPVLVFLSLISLTLVTVDSARILGVYPTPSISHQVVFRAVTLELVKRGHEVVVITPDPIFKNKTSPKNLLEIDTSEEYQMQQVMLKEPDIRKYYKRGVVINPAILIDKDILFNMSANVFNNPEVNRLIKDKSQKFDLVIYEALAPLSLILSEIYQAPAVMFSSFLGVPHNYETVGAAARHPTLYPYMFKDKFRNLTFMDKLEQLYTEYKVWKFERRTKEIADEFLKARFGPNTPSIYELEKHVVLFLVNCHPIIDNNRPVPPGAVYLGALHLQPIKPLPEDLKLYLDNSSRGVVYVSLGTNVRPSEMDKKLLDAFLDAFERIPYDILWKFDGDNLDRIPKNVKIQKWFPQRDLLVHPNVRLFVMQGGMQSTDEAIDAEVPLVGIPMLGDQWYNTDKYVELGIGVAVDSYTMTADDLVKAVNKVASNPSYKESMMKLKAIMRDQPETALKRAVWWTEHVLRHKGSRHLLGAAAQVSWSEYLMLDVFIPLAIGLIILAYVTLIGIRFFVTLVFRMNSYVKVKVN